MNPRLLGVGGPLKGTEFPLAGGEVSVGRDSSNQLCVADPALSRRHCVVIADGEKFSIRDLRSRNGTLVNGVPVAPTVCLMYRHCISTLKGGASHKNMAHGYTLPALAPTPKFLLRLPADVRAELQKIADDEHRTLTNLIVHVLREWLAGRGRSQP